MCVWSAHLNTEVRGQLQESVLSFHREHPRDPIQVSRRAEPREAGAEACLMEVLADCEESGLHWGDPAS